MIWHGAGTIFGVLSQKPCAENGQFRVAGLRLARMALYGAVAQSQRRLGYHGYESISAHRMALGERGAHNSESNGDSNGEPSPGAL